MTIADLLYKLKEEPSSVSFAEVMDVIDENYNFTPTAFQNGTTHNAAGINSGSCKLFSFAQIHKLSKEETLACFGSYYFKDVLEDMDGDSHQNIRNFMQYGWQGIQFEGLALDIK